MSVKPIPERLHTITPHLTVHNIPKLIDFLEKAFDAKLNFPPMTRPDGKIMHAEMKIGDSIIMMGEPMIDEQTMPGDIHIYVPDMDTTYKRAIDAGATSLFQPANQFYGDRGVAVKDPCGNLWWIATHIEDVPPGEMKKRADAFMKQHFP